MSLHKFADMVASKGRGDDSLLIHMTPDEVQRLQAFAQANGRSLTINPDTGLPEAGMLSDLFKMVAPIALGAFLGPAGVAFGGPGLSAAMAGVATGGLTTLATGSLSRGLMAGLGAYGGAGLGESLMGAGTGGLAAADIAAQQAAGSFPALAEGATQEQIAKYATDVGALRDAAVSKAGEAGFMSKASAGLGAIADNPSAYGKDLFKYGSAAAMPIMAGAMVPTTTKLPENTSPAYIRQKLYDPYTQTYKSLTPIKANEFGSRSFSDAYTNPQTGEMATLQPRAPSGFAGGGIVALAIGGDTKAALEEAYAANDVAKINEIAQANMVTAADIADTYKGFDTSGIKGLQLYTPPNFGDSVSAVLADQGGGGGTPAYNQYSNEQIASYLLTNPTADLQQAIKDTNADPAAVNAYIASLDNPFRGSTDTTGGSGTLGIYNQMKAQGIDPNELYAASTAFDPKYAGWSKEDIQRGYNLDKGAYALSDQLGGKVADKDWAKFMDDNKYSVNDMAQAFGLSRNEVQARYDAAKKPPIKPPVTFTNPVTGGTLTPPIRVTDTVLPTDPTVNAPPGTKNPYGNVNNPGDLTFNADGSITVQPNIPGRPYGGFSGMNEVKNAYTAGGGSLGYTAKAPKTIEEFNQLYNKQTGDSLAAYDYLMGKGGGKYPVQSQAASRSTGIMRPYFSEGMRYKPKFLSYDSSGNTVSSSTNPATSKPAAAASGTLKAKAINVLNSEGNTEEATLREDGYYYTSGGRKFDVAGAEVAAGGGMMGYAMGGGLGSLGSYSDGGRLLKGPGDGVSDSIPATIGRKNQPARLADGEFVIPARIVSELGNGSTDAGAKKLYAMMDRVQRARGKTTGKNKVAANSRADKHLPA